MKKTYQKPEFTVSRSEEVIRTSGELFTIEGSYSGQSVDWNDNWN